MARLQVTVETAPEGELQPALKHALLLELETYAYIKVQQEELARALTAVVGNIETLREEADTKSIRLEGVGLITRVDGGTVRTLNKKRLCSKGITPAMLEDCYDSSPKRPYTLVTLSNDATKNMKGTGDSE